MDNKNNNEKHILTKEITVKEITVKEKITLKNNEDSGKNKTKFNVDSKGNTYIKGDLTLCGDLNFQGKKIKGYTGSTGNTGNTGNTGSTGPTGSLAVTLNNAGSTSQSNLLWTDGAGSYYYNSSKTFVIEHPLNENKYLIHACLEGPEAGVYYRGSSCITNNSHIEICLPNYVEAIATNFTVQITPIYNENISLEKNYSTSRVTNNLFTVYGNNGEFFWHVTGTRQFISVEPNKTDVEVKGTGPYKWV